MLKSVRLTYFTHCQCVSTVLNAVVGRRRRCCRCCCCCQKSETGTQLTRNTHTLIASLHRLVTRHQRRLRSSTSVSVPVSVSALCCCCSSSSSLSFFLFFAAVFVVVVVLLLVLLGRLRLRHRCRCCCCSSSSSPSLLSSLLSACSRSASFATCWQRCCASKIVIVRWCVLWQQMPRGMKGFATSTRRRVSVCF